MYSPYGLWYLKPFSCGTRRTRAAPVVLLYSGSSQSESCTVVPPVQDILTEMPSPFDSIAKFPSQMVPPALPVIVQVFGLPRTERSTVTPVVVTDIPVPSN